MPLGLLALSILLRHPGERSVSITIDDLPFVSGSKRFEDALANTDVLLRPLRSNHIPCTGFVVGSGFDAFGSDKANTLYHRWLDAGFELGNHTWTHADYNSVPLAAYEQEVIRTDAAIRTAQGSVRYFRAPYLNDGLDSAGKATLSQFLADHNYTVAPVTLDSDEYKFATPYDVAVSRGNRRQCSAIERTYVRYWAGQIAYFEKQSRRALGRECAQIILLHANRLTAKTMPQILATFVRRGYRFVSLTQALKDPAYRLPDTYVGSGGYSWIFRWGLAKGVRFDPFPKPPDWVEAAFAEASHAGH